MRIDIVQTIGIDRAMQDSFWDSLIKTTPLGKLASAKEIAYLIMYIASDKAKSITGSTFVSDNGPMLVHAIGNI